MKIYLYIFMFDNKFPGNKYIIYLECFSISNKIQILSLIDYK